MTAVLLAVSLMAGRGPTTLYFSAGGGCLWQHVTAHGQMLGAVPDTAIEPVAGCYGMGRLRDGSIWIATEHHFWTLSADLKTHRGGTVTVEQIAGASGRHLYRIRRGHKLPLKPPHLEHATILEEIDPTHWTITRTWTLPGQYRSYGRGHLAVNLAESVAYYATEHASGTIHRHDLQADQALPDLVERSVGSSGIIVQPDGSIVVGYTDRVQRFAVDGTHLTTYAVGALPGQGLIAHGSDASRFWVMGFADGGDHYATMFEFEQVSGTLYHEWPLPKNGVRWDAPFVDPPSGAPFDLVATSGVNDFIATFLADGTLVAEKEYPNDATHPDVAVSVADDRIYANIMDAGNNFTVRVYDLNLTFVTDIIIDSGTPDNWSSSGWVGGVYVPQAGVVWASKESEVGGPTPPPIDRAAILEFTPAGAFSRYVASNLHADTGGTFESTSPRGFCAIGSILYYLATGFRPGAPSSSDLDGIYRHDLDTDTPLSALVIARSHGDATKGAFRSIRRNAAGTEILVGFDGPTSAVRRYDATTGALILEQPIASNNVSGVTYDTDPAFVWTGSEYDSILRRLQTSDLSEVSQFTSTGDTANIGTALASPSGVTMACPDPCADAGIGDPYFALLPEGTATYFYDRAFALIAQFGSPSGTVVGVAMAPTDDGVWIAYDDSTSGGSFLFKVDPADAAQLRGPISVMAEDGATPVRIAELGGRRALFVLSCDRLLTVDRGTHELIEICLPVDPGLDDDGIPLAPEGDALVATRYSLVINPLDAQLVDGGENLLYIDGGVAKLWNLENEALVKTIGTVGGIWPTVLTDNTFLVFTGTFRGHGDVLRYSRTGTLLRRYTYNQGEFSTGLYNMASDIATDACSCGNAKDGLIFLPGEDIGIGGSGVIWVRLLDGSSVPNEEGGGTASVLPDITEGGIDTASAFAVLGALNTGSGFSDQSGGTTTRPTPNRHCGPEAGVSSPAPNAGCNAGGKGWTPSYAGVSGTVPDAPDPSGEETLTGKTDALIRVKVRHSTGGSPEDEVLCCAKVDLPSNALDLDMHPHAEPRVLSIGDDDRGLSDGQGNLVSGSTHVQFMDGDGRPFGIRLRSATRKYWTRDELILEAVTPAGIASNATPRRIGTGLIYGEDYGGPRVFGLTAVDPLFVEGGSFGPDKKVPQWTYPLSFYSNAPADLASVPMPIIYGEVSDEGAVSPVTGLPNSRGKCPVRFVGMDTLGTAGGGASWGRFNLCLFAIYDIVALYGSDLGGMGLYGAAASVATVETSDLEDPEATTESVVVSLDGSPDLTSIATDGTMQIVLFTTSGRMEAPIIGVDLFARTVSIETPIEADVATNIAWYISSIDYVPRRVQIDLSTRNGVDVQVPHWAGYIRPTPYEDFTADGEDYRVTDLWANGALLAAHLAGEVTLAANVIGVEDEGDGSGLPLIDYFVAFNHFLDNCVHVQRPKPAGPGARWPQVAADLPQFSDGFSKTKQSTFETAQAITVRGIGGRGLQVNAWFGDGISTRDAMQRWIENGGCKAGIDEYGRFYVWMLDRYADTSTWPHINHVNRVFAEPPHRTRALEEAANAWRGGCDYDPEGMAFREDDLKAVSSDAIQRNKSILKPSKHVDLTLLAYKEQAQWILDRALLVNQDGPLYLLIQGLDYGVLDIPIGSGVFVTSQMLPGADEDGMVDQPAIVLHRTFDMDTGLVVWTCLDLGQDAEGGSLLVPAAKRMIATDVDALAPPATDDEAIAPVAA